MAIFIQLKPSETDFTLKSIDKNIIQRSQSQESSNPLFNFSEQFVKQLQSITPLELASSVPYIGLRALDEYGKIIHDFNKELFFKPIDFSKMNSGERFADRPTASLIDVKIKSSTGSGYIYFQDVIFTIKIHKPDVALNSTLIALLFPGMPMELEYGWHNSASENDLLNKTEKLAFALKNYNLNFTVDGQIDLTVDGTAFNERLTNTLIGDEQIVDKNLLDNLLEIKDPEQKKDIEARLASGGLTSVYAAINSYQDFFKNLEQNPDKAGIRDMKTVKSMFNSYESVLNRARGSIRTNFQNNVKQTKELKQSSKKFLEKDNIKHQFKNGMITVHDLVSTMCGKTFDTLQKITGGATIRFVYGLFHNEAGAAGGTYQGEAISDFPIDYGLFLEQLGIYTETNGTEVLTIEGLFAILINEFFHNEAYWRILESIDEGISLPHIYLGVNNYVVKQNNQPDKRFMDISLIDINRDVPMTSGIIEDLIDNKKSTVNDFENKVKSKAPTIPIIKLGHGNSFIREINMQNVTDEYIKAALIKRMADNSSIYTRAFIPPGFQNAIEGTNIKTPLQLPLQGTMTTLGCVEWKPFRAFCLISGIYVIDALYKILDTEHTINNQGFQTTIRFMWN